MPNRFEIYNLDELDVKVNNLSGYLDSTLTSFYSLKDNDSVSLPICTPVYSDSNNTIKKAKADSSATKNVCGLVRDTSISSTNTGFVQFNGLLLATVLQWSGVFGTSSGLIANTKYYLSDTVSGNASSIAPTGTGRYIVELGQAISTTGFIVNIKQSILL